MASTSQRKPKKMAIPEYLSLGAGVQSSTIAFMAAYGEITPMPKGAIFADTGAEPSGVYEWLKWMEELLPFPVHRVMEKDGLKAAILGSTSGFFAAPFYTTSANGGGLTRRQCTREFKIAPITRKLRELEGIKPRQHAKGTVAIQWIGISWDEMQRMKEPRVKWLKHRWPLIEKQMTRLHCLEWMRDHNFPLPQKSSCTFCPYRDNASWRDMKTNDPESWVDAVAMDEAIRDRDKPQQLYVHRSMSPLADADLADPAKDQIVMSFMDECEGMCGV